MVSIVIESTYKPAPEPSKLSPGAIITSGPTLAPNKATQGVKPAPSATCSPPCTLYDEKESCLQHSDSEKDQWTQVTGRIRRRARLPPCLKMRFPVHLQASLHIPTSSPATEESSEWKRVRTPMTEKVHSVLGAQSQLRLLPELGQNLRPNYL